MWTSSALSISNSIPVILPARSGNKRCLLWRRSTSWSHHLAWHHLGWWVASSGCVLEALLRAHLLSSNHWHWWHSWSGHHGHWLRTRLVHRPRLLLTNSGSSNPWSTRSDTSSHAHASHAQAGHASGPRHSLLLWPTGLGADLSGGEEALGLGHGGHEVAY